MNLPVRYFLKRSISAAIIMSTFVFSAQAFDRFAESPPSIAYSWTTVEDTIAEKRVTSFSSNSSGITERGEIRIRNAVYPYTWNSGGGTESITFLGQTFTGTRGELHSWARKQVLSYMALSPAHGSNPQSPHHRAADIALHGALISRASTQDLPKSIKKGPHPGRTGTSTWNFDVEVDTEYEHVWHQSPDTGSDRLGLTMKASLDMERISFDVAVPINGIWFDTGFETLDSTQVGLVVTPRLHLLNESSDGVDLAVGITGSYFHAFMHEPGIDDPDHAGWGPVLSVHKTFGTLKLGTGIVYHTTHNLDEAGDMNKDDDNLSVSKWGTNVGIPMSDKLAINAAMTYTHTFDLPDAMDADFWTLDVGAVFTPTATCSVDLGLRTHLGYDHSNNVELHGGLRWDF